MLGKGHRGWARISAAKNVAPPRRLRKGAYHFRVVPIIASSRADLDVLVKHLEGRYPPDPAKMRGTIAGAFVMLIAAPLLPLLGVLGGLGAEGPLWILLALATALAILALMRLADALATYRVEPLLFARDGVPKRASWTIPLADVDTISLERGKDWFLLITTAANRRRPFRLTKAAQDRLATLYPEAFGLRK